MKTEPSVFAEPAALEATLAPSSPSCERGSEHGARLPNLLAHLRHRQSLLQQAAQTTRAAGAMLPCRSGGAVNLPYSSFV
jgi:hypothetical protein